MSSFLRRLFGTGSDADRERARQARNDPGRGPLRDRGNPPSGNGASSLHLAWDLPGRFERAEVTLEVIEPPVVNRLYFWALQASFTDRGRHCGAAHLGLQWHPDYPGSTAVNWGGYRAGGGELDGTRSLLPSTLGNVNTRDYRWAAGRAYRLTIEPAPAQPGSWRGSVTDIESGATTAVRDLHTGGSELEGIVMWSEVFARCDHPSAAVRWSQPVAYRDGGQAHRPATVSVNYQSHRDGGCSNTSSNLDAYGVVQRTNTARITAQGARLTLPAGETSLPAGGAPLDG